MSRRSLVVAILVVFSCHVAVPQVVSVDPLGKSRTQSSTPTLSFLWQSDTAKAVLIMIPGGEGHIGLTPEQKQLFGFYGSALRPLSDSHLTRGLFHVVIFDSPSSLYSGPSYPISRTTADHLTRIESVVRFYKTKLTQNPKAGPKGSRGKLVVEVLGKDEEVRHGEEGTHGRADHRGTEAA